MIEANRPPRLVAGAHIRVVAPAGRVTKDRLELGIHTLRKRGYQVTLGEHIWDQDGYLAGCDQARAHDLEEALCDDAVDAVFLARGGWGTMRALALLSTTRISQARPKIVLGYSDITALHAYLNARGWVTFHGPVVEMDWDSKNGSTALAVVSGETGALGDAPMEHLVQTGSWRDGSMHRLVGGNLSVFCSMIGTSLLSPVAGRVLFLEEVQEAPYRIDRMMTQLRLAGVLQSVNAVIFGEATRCVNNPEIENYSARDVVIAQCQAAAVDLFWGLPAGHGPEKLTIPLEYPLAIRQRRLFLTEPAVS